MMRRALLAVMIASWVACGGGGSASSGDSRAELPGAGETLVNDAVIAGDPLGEDAFLPDAPGGPPPRIAFLLPAPGTYATQCGAPATVRIVVASSGDPLAEVRVAGQAVEPREGDHEVLVSLASGLNVLDASARTVHGAQSWEHRAVLCGEYRPPSEAVTHAADLYLGRDALAVLGLAAARFVDTADLSGLARGMNPLYRSSIVTVNADQVSVSPGTVVTLKPAWGLIVVGLAILDLDVRVIVSVLDRPATTWPVRVRTDRLSAEGMVTLEVAADRVAVALTGMTLDLGDPVVTVEGLADDLLAVFPEYRDTILGTITGFLARLLEDQVTRAVASAFERLEDPIPLEALGRTFALRFAPSLAEVTPAGVHVGLDVGVTGLEPVHGQGSPGVLATLGQEEWPDAAGVRISLKDDFLNAVFHETWRSGLLQFTVDQAFLDAHKVEVDLVAGFLGGVLALLPGTPVDPESRIAVDLVPTFPPVASLDLPVSGGVRLGVGDLGARVRLDGTPDAVLLDLTTNIRLDGELVPSEASGTSISLALHALDVALDVVDPDGTFAGVEAYLEDTTSGLLEALGPTVSGLLRAIPLPSLGGFVVTNVHVGTDREDGGVLYVTGDLVEAGP